MKTTEPAKKKPDLPGSEDVNRVMGVKEWVMILILSVIWGSSFFFIGVTVKEMTPLTVVMFRVTIASTALLIVVYAKKERMPTSPGMLAGFLVMGAFFNVIPYSLIVWGQTHIESGLASILNGTTPIFSVILAHFMTREERLTGNRVAGVLIGWLGVAVLIGIEFLQGFGIEVVGQIAVLGASLCYALGAIYGRRFKDVSPLVVATGMLCASSIIITPLALFIEQPWNLSPGIFAVLALLGLAVINTSFAHLIYFRVLAVAGPTNSLLVTFLVPINAILLGYLFLGERLGWNAFAGMGMIFLGLAAIDGRPIKVFKRKKRG